MTYLRLFLVLILGFVGTECSAQKLRVVASFSILADVIKNIGGDDIEVISIVGPNSDTHVYKPTPDDSKKILSADLVVISGLGFEGWFKNLVDASGYRGDILMASQKVPPLMMGGELKSAASTTPDPHVWNDVQNVLLWVQEIRTVLMKKIPSKKEVISQRATRYGKELQKLDRWIKSSFEKVPDPTRKIITAHDAFSYFGRAYGITFLAPSGLSTEDEPSAFEVADLIRQIKRENIQTVFVENISSQHLIEQISRETGAKIGGVLYSDALSEEGTSGDSYLKLMRHNVSLFVRSFSQEKG